MLKKNYYQRIYMPDEDGDKNYAKNFEAAVKDYAKDKKKKVQGPGVNDKANSETDAKTKLKNELNDLKSDYEKITERTFGGVTIKDYEPEIFDGKTDEEIRSDAENKYLPAAEREKESLVRKKNNSIDKLAAGIGDAEHEKNEKIDKLESDYADDFEKVKNSAVKRGLARSSILDGELSGLAEGLENDKNDAEETAENKKDKIRNNIAATKEELYYAIRDLDEETAEKIKNEINKLTSAREKEREQTEQRNRKKKEAYDKQVAASEKNGVKYDEKLTDEYSAYYGEKFKKLFSYYKKMGAKGKDEVIKDKDFIVENIDEDGYKLLLGYM